MVIGKLLNLDIADGDKLVETCWELARDEAMTLDKTTYYTTKPDELEAYVFQNITVAKDANYYGRAKYRTELRGWSDWNNLDIIAVASTEDIGEVKTLPSRLGVPRVDTYVYNFKNVTDVEIGTTPCPALNHPVIGFAIKADGYSSITGATHVATSYYIEDVDRNVIWKSENDTINLYLKKVDTLAIEDNKVYRARVVFHSSTNDVSDGGTKTFVTKMNKDKTYASYLESFFDPKNFFLGETNVFIPPVGHREVGSEVMIMDYNTYGSKIIFSSVTQSTKNDITIPTGTLAVDRVYVVLYRTYVWNDDVPDKETNNVPTEDKTHATDWDYVVIDTRNHREHPTMLPTEPFSITPTATINLSNGVYEIMGTSGDIIVSNIRSSRGLNLKTVDGAYCSARYTNDVIPLSCTVSVSTTPNFDFTASNGSFDVRLEAEGNTPTDLKFLARELDVFTVEVLSGGKWKANTGTTHLLIEKINTPCKIKISNVKDMNTLSVTFGTEDTGWTATKQTTTTDTAEYDISKDMSSPNYNTIFIRSDKNKVYKIIGECEEKVIMPNVIGTPALEPNNWRVDFDVLPADSSVTITKKLPKEIRMTRLGQLVAEFGYTCENPKNLSNPIKSVKLDMKLRNFSLIPQVDWNTYPTEVTTENSKLSVTSNSDANTSVITADSTKNAQIMTNGQHTLYPPVLSSVGFIEKQPLPPHSTPVDFLVRINSRIMNSILDNLKKAVYVYDTIGRFDIPQQYIKYKSESGIAIIIINLQSKLLNNASGKYGYSVGFGSYANTTAIKPYNGTKTYPSEVDAKFRLDEDYQKPNAFMLGAKYGDTNGEKIWYTPGAREFDTWLIDAESAGYEDLGNPFRLKIIPCYPCYGSQKLSKDFIVVKLVDKKGTTVLFQDDFEFVYKDMILELTINRNIYIPFGTGDFTQVIISNSANKPMKLKNRIDSDGNEATITVDSSNQLVTDKVTDITTNSIFTFTSGAITDESLKTITDIPLSSLVDTCIRVKFPGVTQPMERPAPNMLFNVGVRWKSGSNSSIEQGSLTNIQSRYDGDYIVYSASIEMDDADKDFKDYIEYLEPYIQLCNGKTVKPVSWNFDSSLSFERRLKFQTDQSIGKFNGTVFSAGPTQNGDMYEHLRKPGTYAYGTATLPRSVMSTVTGGTYDFGKDMKVKFLLTINRHNKKPSGKVLIKDIGAFRSHTNNSGAIRWYYMTPEDESRNTNVDSNKSWQIMGTNNGGVIRYYTTRYYGGINSCPDRTKFTNFSCSVVMIPYSHGMEVFDVHCSTIPGSPGDPMPIVMDSRSFKGRVVDTGNRDTCYIDLDADSTFIVEVVLHATFIGNPHYQVPF